MCITIGFFVYDFPVVAIQLNDGKALAKQMILHHVIGIFGSLVALYGGSGVISLSSFQCINEFSNPYLSIRSKYLDDGNTGTTSWTIN